jgi:8-oxo-dGTP pyrophosphatase MutT (NUDIX family)
VLALTEPEIARLLAAAYRSAEVDRTATQFTITSCPAEPPRAAAVLIPILRVEGEWHVLYTRRTDTVADHKGQVAFPGGSSDPDDPSPEATALREAHEEIGLNPQDVRILGRLNSLLTITNYCVTPVVGAIPWPYPLHLETSEVSRAFTIPLAWLADPDPWEVQQHVLPGRPEPHPVIYFQLYEGELLWGVSAQITINLIKVLFNHTPTAAPGALLSV